MKINVKKTAVYRALHKLTASDTSKPAKITTRYSGLAVTFVTLVTLILF